MNSKYIVFDAVVSFCSWHCALSVSSCVIQQQQHAHTHYFIGLFPFDFQSSSYSQVRPKLFVVSYGTLAIPRPLTLTDIPLGV